MRRSALILLFALTLVTPFVLRQVLGKSARPTTVDADHALLIITAHNESICREFRQAFLAWHAAKFGGPPVEIEFNVQGGYDIFKYFQDASRAHAPFRADVIWGGGDYLFDVQLKKYLQPLTLPPPLMAATFPQPTLNGVALYDAAKVPAWYGSALASFGIIYNKDVLRYLHLPEPKTWKNLADPSYRGWLILADPTRSAAAKQAFMIIVERAMADAKQQGRSEDEGWRDGMTLIRQIAANVRNFGSSSESLPGQIANGDGAAAMCIDFYARAQVDAVGESRLGYVEPLGATAITPDPIALVKGAPHRELAIQFIEFVLSEPGQKIWNTRPGSPGGPRETALRRLPIMPSVYQHAEDFTDKVDPYHSAGSFNKSSAREKTFPILGELIEFSCMDNLDELRAVGSKVGRFPFDQQGALERAGEWGKASPAKQLELREKWIAEFREEYRKLRDEGSR